MTYKCEQCGLSLWLPIAALKVSTLGLYDDARYPGRCLLILNQHCEDLADLPADIMCAYARDAQQAGRAIRQATGADRMNYAVLGNAEPHLHFHLIPRRLTGDPVPKQSPWSTNVAKTALRKAERDRLMNAIAQALE